MHRATLRGSRIHSPLGGAPARCLRMPWRAAGPPATKSQLRVGRGCSGRPPRSRAVGPGSQRQVTGGPPKPEFGHELPVVSVTKLVPEQSSAPTAERISNASERRRTRDVGAAPRRWHSDRLVPSLAPTTATATFTANSARHRSVTLDGSSATLSTQKNRVPRRGRAHQRKSPPRGRACRQPLPITACADVLLPDPRGPGREGRGCQVRGQPE